MATTVPGRHLNEVKFATSCAYCGTALEKGRRGCWYARAHESKSGKGEVFCGRPHAELHYGVNVPTGASSAAAAAALPATPDPERVNTPAPEPARTAAEALEFAKAEREAVAAAAAIPEPKDDVERLLQIVRTARERAIELKLPVLITPRASIDGAKLLKAGLPLEVVLDIRVFGSLNDDTRRQLHAPVSAGALCDYAPAVKRALIVEGVAFPETHHELLPIVVACARAGLNVLLVGPAGSGKSYLGEQLSEVLGRGFGSSSFGPTTPTSKLFGFNDAHGNFNGTPYHRCWSEGGVFVGDELDNGHPGLVAELNQALAGTTAAFACGNVTKHPDHVFIGTANTFGRGPDRQYVGRNILDAATLDRFATVEVTYDEALETALAKAAGGSE